jgi:hypothetical protein
MTNGIIHIRNWIRTNGDMSDDGKSITYDCEKLENVITEALRIHDVVGRSEQLKPEPQICYKSNEPCKYNCSGLCKESY